MAEFKLSRIRYKWRGEWLASTDYIPDDIIEYQGKSYVCLVQHTSDADFYTDLRFLNSDVPPAPAPKWLLMIDGYVWTGDWAVDHFYSVGNIVKYAGNVYLCVEEHTSASTVQGFETDIGAWTLHTNSEDWKNLWTPNTYYTLNDTIKYGGIVFRCIVPHTSAADYIDGIEPDLFLNKWQVVSFGQQWHSDWATNTRYHLNDIIKYGGIVYRCTEGHTSASTANEGLEQDLGKWTIVRLGIDFKGTWVGEVTGIPASPGVRYKLNDVVKYGPELWFCIGNHISTETFDPAYWEIFVPGFEYEYAWDVATIYQPGDVVNYGGYLYVSKTHNVGKKPSDPVNINDWDQLYLGTRIRGEYDRTAQYIVGDLVRRKGQLYVAIADSQGQDTDLPDDGSTIDSTYWELVVPGEKWEGVWLPATQYVIGDTVTWMSNVYRCLAIHTSRTSTRPDKDTANTYWTLYTAGTNSNRLKNIGDIKTYGLVADNNTYSTKELAIGINGDVLKVVAGEAQWSPLWESDKVYYVGTDGVDDLEHGTTLNSPWRTIRYATEHVTGTATIYVKHGTYDEVLPIRVPAFVAIVGDEIRGVIVRPAETKIPSTDVAKSIAALTYVKNIMPSIINLTPVSTLYSLVILQDTEGTAGSPAAVSAVQSLLDTITTIISNPGSSFSITGTNTPSVNTGVLDAITNIENNRAFIVQEAVAYIQAVNSGYTFNQEMCERDINSFIDAIKYDLLYTGNWKSVEAANYYCNAADGARNARQNMFLLRDGTGIRNMTLKGLSGEYTVANQYLTKRVTAGAFVSLDPGWGPDDSSAWVGTKSPYIQNVTNFGDKCVGLKVDGDLHNGGNQTIVANDFTQVLSDGIGAWVNGNGKSELVSVFTYYNYIGYLAENGGKIRATNGNNSYGTLGCVAEGSDINEEPITAVVNNKSYEAQLSSTLLHNGSIMKLFFSNAGLDYTNVNYTVTGSGADANLTGNEFRDGGVYEARIVDRGDSTALGGLQYLFNTNNAQQGDTEVIRLAASDSKTAAQYEGMRIFIEKGTGTGQYGYVACFDPISKDITVADERYESRAITQTVDTTNVITISSTQGLAADMKVVLSGTAFGGLQYGVVYYVKQVLSLTQIKLSATLGGGDLNVTDDTGTMDLHVVGWNQILPGHPMESTLDTTSVYYIEPRVTFSSPGFTTGSGSLSNSSQWKSVAYGNNTFVAVSPTALNTSTNGTSWSTGSIPAGDWRAVGFGNGTFVIVAASGTEALYSTNASSWTSTTIPAGEYRSVAYGDVVDTWVAVSANSAKAAYSVDGGQTWSAAILPEGAEWNSVAYGNGKFVAVGVSDSSLTQTAYSTDGVFWDAGSYIGGCEAVTFGNGRFVAIDGTSSTTSFISLDGINWTAGELPGAASSWKTVTYGGGLFLATITGSANAAVSTDGLFWEAVALGASSSWGSSVYGAGKFIVLSGVGSNSDVVRTVTTGAIAMARAMVVSGKVSEIAIWEPGSGYTSAPAITIYDPNATADVAIDVRTGNGVIANPTLTNAGQYYVSCDVTFTGNGYMDSYQIGKYLVVDELSRAPRPGDNMFINGINDYTYRVLNVEILGGTAPNLQAKLTFAKILGRAESPEHGELVTIRQNYSQVRITGHDFLDIGLGNFIQTNYPDTLNPNGTVLAPENEFGEFGGGRVFYTSTDQDGNFRVGELFAVEQASGTVTLSSDFFQLEGLEELVLGGIAVGGTGTVIREFSPDSTFVADSNNIIPTQRAIKAYVSARVSGGGSDARTGQAISGLVIVGPDYIRTSTNTQIDIPMKVNFTNGVDGSMLALAYFMDSMSND